MILDARRGVRGVIPLAWRRRMRTPTADDPRLRAFADAWLGPGSAGK